MYWNIMITRINNKNKHQFLDWVEMCNFWTNAQWDWKLLLPTNLDCTWHFKHRSSPDTAKNISEINEKLSNGLSECLPIRLAAHSATSHAHEIGLLSPCLADKNMPNDPENWYPTSSSQLDVLMVCLNHVKAFAENFLALPLAEYAKLSASQ